MRAAVIGQMRFWQSRSGLDDLLAGYHHLKE
ncbi:Uncharacterised protein [Vibrio cholerae]|nr:Uncharacterised protein [Vibrio cholerae]